MILDTTYLLPLARIDVDTDLLRASVEGRANIELEGTAVSLISLFELQAKAAKLGVTPVFVSEALRVINKAFRVIPFYRDEVVEMSFALRKVIPDYVDCVILATAVTSSEDLVTEDSLLLAKRDSIEEEHGIKVYSFMDLVGSTSRVK
jgi:predicted nucleic acid-binding protein